MSKNLLEIAIALIIGNFGYQYFNNQNWELALGLTILNIYPLIFVWVNIKFDEFFKNN